MCTVKKCAVQLIRRQEAFSSEIYQVLYMIHYTPAQMDPASTTKPAVQGREQGIRTATFSSNNHTDLLLEELPRP